MNDKIAELMADAVKWSDAYERDIDVFKCRGRDTDDCSCGEPNGCGEVQNYDDFDQCDYDYWEEAAEFLQAFAQIQREKVAA